jgi:hypothetical protein
MRSVPYPKLIFISTNLITEKLGHRKIGPFIHLDSQRSFENVVLRNGLEKALSHPHRPERQHVAGKNIQQKKKPKKKK